MLDDLWDTISDISWSDVWDVAKVAVPIAGSIYGASSASDANQNAANQTIQATNAQADQLQLGYDERLDQQLRAFEAARGNLDARHTAILDILTTAQQQYAGNIVAAANAYIQRMPAMASQLGDLLTGNAQQIGQKLIGAAAAAGGEMMGAAGQYGGAITDAAGRYSGAVTAGADRARAEILQAPEELARYLQPYADTGLEMAGQMRRIALSDPTRMTDAQRILLEDSRRDMGNRLATSGLRGSAGGIAAAMDAEARQRAGFVTENRNRSDNFMGTLNQQGFQAANTLGSAKANALIQAAGVGWEASKLGAGAVMAAEQQAAKAGLEAKAWALKAGLDAERYAADAEMQAFRDSINMQWSAAQKTGEVGLTAARDVAQNQYQTAGQVAGQVGNYFDKLSAFDLQEGEAIGNAAFGKREAEARSLGPVAAVQGAADVADAKLWGSAIGQITRMIADERTLGSRPGVYSNSTVSGGNSTVAGGGSGIDNWGYL